MAPSKDTLLPAITRLLQETLTELAPADTVPVRTYRQMAETSPILGAALQVITQLGVLMLGEYEHPDLKIQDFIRANFEQMRGSLQLSLEELLSAFPFGHSLAQWGVESREGQTWLIDVQILDPEKYRFEGRVGLVENVVYKGEKGDIKLPYGGEKGRFVHVINQRHLCYREPYGIAALRRAKAAWEAWKIIMGELLVAAQRQATPIIVGYADSNATVPLLDSTGAPVLDKDGEPAVVPAPRALLEQLESLDNRSVLSTDVSNRIEALAQNASGDFFFGALNLLQQYQLQALLVPQTILVATGVGDSNLNTGHRSTLGSVVRSLVSQIKEQLLETVVRWLIVWNFGENVEELGSFTEPKLDEIAPLDIVDRLTAAVQGGWILPSDLAATNKGREILGMEPLDESAIATQQPLTTMARFGRMTAHNYYDA